MTIQDIQKELNDKYVGTECSTYGGKTNLYCLASELITRFGAEGFDKITWTNEKNQYGMLEYKGYTILTFRIKKARGAHHYAWGSGYYDWAVKEVILELAYGFKDKTFEEIFAECDELADKANKAKEDKEDRAVEVIKNIMTTYNIDYYNACYLCNYISKNMYSLKDRFDKAGN